MRASTLIFLVVATLVAAGARAQWRDWDSDFDEDKKPWKEIEAKIPPYPKDADLVQFDAGAATSHRFFLDASSIIIGDDQVVRYTLVVKTSGGATNVTFEGIRCQAREQKTYALGHLKNREWGRARNPQWRYIQYHEINRHHGALFADYLCGGTASERYPLASVKEMLQRIRYGPPAQVTQ
jgi:hypothetical protein